MALTLVVHLFAADNNVAALQAYEAKVLPLLADHGGRLKMAFSPSPAISTAPDLPDEIHILTFPSTDAFQAYRADPRHKQLADERSRSIARTEILGSDARIIYD